MIKNILAIRDICIAVVPGYVFSGVKGVIRVILAGKLYLQFINSNKEFISHVRKPHYNLKDASFWGEMSSA